MISFRLNSNALRYSLILLQRLSHVNCKETIVFIVELGLVYILHNLKRRCIVFHCMCNILLEMLCYIFGHNATYILIEIVKSFA